MADAAEPAADGANEPGNETGGFPRNADYCIHILIQKTKEIKTPPQGTVDPMFQIECLGLKQFSSAKDDIGTLTELTWDEHIFIEPRNIEQRDADSGKIAIKLMDKGLFKDAMIGMFELDLSFIYLKENHILENKWLALNNPGAENFSEICGYIKVSISVCATGDEQTELKLETEEPENPQIMMSPSLNPTFYQVTIRIFQGQDLPPMDAGMLMSKPKIDAYIRINFKNKILKTKICKFTKGGDPVDWNMEFLLPCQLPVLAPYINLRLMDEDVGSDEMAGTIQIFTKDLIEKEYMHNLLCWKSFYGSPLNQSGSDAKTLMNREPNLASNWKGRLLVQTIVEKCEKPKHLVRPIEMDQIMLAEPFLKNRTYKFICQIGQAVALPTNKAYKIRVTLGGHEVIFDPMPQKNPANYKRYGRCDPQTIELPFVNAEDFGKIIFQLMDDDDPVCFYIAEAKNFVTHREKSDFEKENEKQGPRMQWVQFLPDMCVKKVKQPHLAGLFSFRMELHDVTTYGDINFKEKKAWSQKIAKRANPVKIRAYIYLCRGLPAADSSGTSDPYIQVWDTVPEKKETKCIEDNNNPLFYETLELDYEVENQEDLESYPPFIFDVYDKDSGILDSTDDFLGRAIIEPEDCALITQQMLEDNNNDELTVPVEPRWHPFYYSAGDPKEGEVLVAFSVVEHDYNFKLKAENLDLNSRVKKLEHNLNILILGLRNLQSPGILPVKKAFIQFKCKSIVPAGTASVTDVTTNPNTPGPNPTINSTIKIKLPLPVYQLYCPNLTCVVFDQIFKGWNQPQIGVFTLNIGELKQALQEERDEETGIMEEILVKLKKIIESPETSIPSYGGTGTINKSTTAVNNSSLVAPDANTSMYSGYSEDVDTARRESNQKMKDKVQKQLKGTEAGIELSESLNANEQTGKIAAQQTQKQKLMSTLQNKQQVMKKIHGAEVANREGKAEVTLEENHDEGEDQLFRMDTMDKGEVKKMLAEAKQLELSALEDERQRAKEELNRTGDKGSKMIIMPQYEMDPRLKVMKECNPPPDSLFMPLGWDENETTKRKHYRQYHPNELEFKKDLFDKPSPFDQFEIIRGSSNKFQSGGLFSSKKPASSDQIKKVGYFKGILEVESYEARDEYRAKKKRIIDQLTKDINTLSMKTLKKPMQVDVSKLANLAERENFQTNMRELRIDHLNISKHLANLESDTILKMMLQNVTKEIIRIYVVEAFGLSSRDNGSASDPYIKLSCNGKTISERDDYQLDNPNPTFYKKYDFEGQFPGSSPLVLGLWDYDAVFGDELIGETIIDVEDRYFNLDWMNLRDKPIEYRDLYHPSTEISQGNVKLWLEIIPADRKELVKEWDISMKPPEYFEVRICVLNCQNIKLDEGGMCDCFFRGFFDAAEEEQETDTHFRCQDGKPDFEYRLIYKVSMPRKDWTFNLQAYDRDFFSSNKLIGATSIDLAQIMEDSSLIKKPLTLCKDYYDSAMASTDKSENKPNFDKEDQNKFWLKLMGKDENGKIDCTGEVRLQINVLPISFAEKNSVGKARDNPNHSPFLPAPEGRIEFSLNPFKMLNQLLSPDLIRKIKVFLCIGVCVALIVIMFPMIFSQMISACILACL